MSKDKKWRELWVQQSTPDFVCNTKEELLECRTVDMMDVPFYRVISYGAHTELLEQAEKLVECLAIVSDITDNESLARRCDRAITTWREYLEKMQG